MNKERDLLLRLLELTDREDGYYVLRGTSHETGNAAQFELAGAMEELLDDVVQWAIDEGEITE